MLAHINHVHMEHVLRNIHHMSATVLKRLSMELIVAKVIIHSFQRVPFFASIDIKIPPLVLFIGKNFTCEKYCSVRV